MKIDDSVGRARNGGRYSGEDSTSFSGRSCDASRGSADASETEINAERFRNRRRETPDDRDPEWGLDMGGKRFGKVQANGTTSERQLQKDNLNIPANKSILLVLNRPRVNCTIDSIALKNEPVCSGWFLARTTRFPSPLCPKGGNSPPA